MKSVLLVLALLFVCASAQASTTKQYHWLWDLIMMQVDQFIFWLVAPWYWWAVFLQQPQKFNEWFITFINDPLWRFSYKYV